MKQKEVIYLVLAAIIFSVAGIIGYQQLKPKNTAVVEVEVVTPINDSFSQAGIQRLNDITQARDFYQTIDPLTQGIGNGAPFGPF